MSATRVNTVGSEFRAILTRIKEVKETLESTDNVELARQLEEVNDSLRILEGNQSEFADAVFKALGNIESKMMEYTVPGNARKTLKFAQFSIH